MFTAPGYRSLSEFELRGEEEVTFCLDTVFTIAPNVIVHTNIWVNNTPLTDCLVPHTAHMHKPHPILYRIWPFILIKPHALTPGDPTWKPCTVMRTVSPTFALLGDIKSLGPLGAAEKRKKDKETKVIELSMGSKSCWTPGLSQKEGDKYNFLSIKVTGRETRDP